MHFVLDTMAFHGSGAVLPPIYTILVMEVAEVCSKRGEAPHPVRHAVGTGGCPSFPTTHTCLITLSRTHCLGHTVSDTQSRTHAVTDNGLGLLCSFSVVAELCSVTTTTKESWCGCSGTGAAPRTVQDQHTILCLLEKGYIRTCGLGLATKES